MLSIAKRTTVGAGLLLIMPVAVWMSGWNWQPGENSVWLRAMYWITETVTQPWGIITHVILCGWFLWCLRFRLKPALMLFAILGCAILAGQGLKSWVKERVQEPRPFVVWLEKTHNIQSDEFYSLKRKERSHLVEEQLINQAAEKSRQADEAAAEARIAQSEAEQSGKDAQAKAAAMLMAADKLEQVAHVVSTASTQLSAQIEQSDKGALDSARRLTDAATAMNEMNATVQSVAQNASEASVASSETRERAVAGARIVEQAVHSIGQVHEVSLRLTENMGQLNDQAQAISKIMNVISDIADQTNLLALNAAIEAARAGEAGRGFAVVADEVRKLAEKTMASTHDVGNAIKAIQESTAKSMAAMEGASEQVNQATEFANQSGLALSEIVTTVEATADQVNAIAAASEQQSAASEEINRSITSVNEVVQQTAEAMNEAARSVSDLARQAHSLSDLIGEMKK